MNSRLKTTPERLALIQQLANAPGYEKFIIGNDDMLALLADATAARDMDALINTPELMDFPKAVHQEAVHQEQRWGTPDRRGKSPQDWYWLVAYLAGRSLSHHVEAQRLLQVMEMAPEDQVPSFQEQIAYHREKAVHHTITAAAALNHWHANMCGKQTSMQPGSVAAQLEGESGSLDTSEADALDPHLPPTPSLMALPVLVPDQYSGR